MNQPLMWTGLLVDLRQESMLTCMLFLLLFIKVAGNESRPRLLLNLINGLLTVNLALGFFPGPDAAPFSGMFHTNRLIVLEKNILNLGTLIVSLQAYDWLKTHRQMLE